MNFDCDAFVSYAERDNVALNKGSEGWVSELHRALEIRVGQLLGKHPKIWRDVNHTEGDLQEDNLPQRLRRVASLVSVVSPSYIKSEFTRKVLSEFWRAAEEYGGVRFRDKARIFKVLKTPVPPEKQSPELRNLLSYNFFKTDPETGTVREFNEVFGPAAQTDYWIRLDDLAHDMCDLLEILEDQETEDSQVVERPSVYLAETTADLREQRDAIKRDLLQRGCEVFPTYSLPMVASDVKATVREDLSRCRMSIHPIGKNYGLIPEGGHESLLAIQNELAVERIEKGGFSRLLWIPLGLQVDDDRQKKMIESIRMDSRPNTDLLETTLEGLKTEIQGRLEKLRDIQSTVDDDRTEVGETLARMYLIYDNRDADSITPWVDFLFGRNIEVLRPLFKGEEAELREYHEENLRTCDGVLIFYGSANESWLRRKLREVQKSAGYGRSKIAPAVAVALMPPKTREKLSFRTHEAIVISQWGGFAAEPLAPFIFNCKEHYKASNPRNEGRESSLHLGEATLDLAVLKIGSMFLARYLIIAELGEGGMGRVYRARDTRLPRDVAIKVLTASLVMDENARSRFVKEAEALANFMHPNIAVIHDAGRWSGIEYIVMECVEGESLKEKLNSGPLPEKEILRLAVQMTEALGEAHEKGIIHRDLKPGNVMVTPKGQVKVLDFGLAKLRSTAESFGDSRAIAGTLPYMAPEQLNGEPVDARTDIYGLGTILFEMATGRRLYPQEMMAHIFDAILRQQPPFARTVNPMVSEELERIINKTLQKDRDQRYQTAADLRADLARLLGVS
jgi:hypothetical protein